MRVFVKTPVLTNNPRIYRSPTSLSLSHLSLALALALQPGCCCFIIVAVFFALFFLIPRAPWIQLESSTLTLAPASFTQTFEFKNNNVYKMNWDDLSLNVYVCEIQQSFPLILNCGSDYTDVLGVATYTGSDSGKFHTDGYASIDLELNYDLDFTKFADVVKICAADHEVIFASEGQVHASLSSGHSFGYVDLEQLMYLSC
jgi:hypothetical protein